MSNTVEYKAWRAMLDRCYRKKNVAYKNYGGRGIQVCERWIESFENFFNDMGERPADQRYTLERRDNGGNYCPENCCWATYEEQRSNVRSNFMITIGGVTKTLSQWCKETGVRRGTAGERIHTMGWEPALAVTKPVRR